VDQGEVLDNVCDGNSEAAALWWFEQRLDEARGDFEHPSTSQRGIAAFILPVHNPSAFALNWTTFSPFIPFFISLTAFDTPVLGDDVVMGVDGNVAELMMFSAFHDSGFILPS
jgi:hypothetical protein